jgi:hypothetical protein
MGERMSERALAFLEEWAAENVHAEIAGPGSVESLAKTLATRCLEDAQTAGIPASEIDEVVDDLAEFMVGQIEEAQDREAPEDDDEGEDEEE